MSIHQQVILAAKASFNKSTDLLVPKTPYVYLNPNVMQYAINKSKHCKFLLGNVSFGGGGMGFCAKMFLVIWCLFSSESLKSKEIAAQLQAQCSQRPMDTTITKEKN